MMKDFELAAKRHEEIQKTAFLSMAAKPLIAAGKWAVSNPIKAVLGGLTVAETADKTRNFTKSIRGAPRAASGTFNVRPTY